MRKSKSKLYANDFIPLEEFLDIDFTNSKAYPGYRVNIFNLFGDQITVYDSDGKISFVITYTYYTSIAKKYSRNHKECNILFVICPKESVVKNETAPVQDVMVKILYVGPETVYKSDMYAELGVMYGGRER
jgi:subtilase family serine protease